MRIRSSDSPLSGDVYLSVAVGDRMIGYRPISPHVDSLVQSGLAAALSLNLAGMAGLDADPEKRAELARARMADLLNNSGDAHTLARFAYLQRLVRFGLALRDERLEFEVPRPRPALMDGARWLDYAATIDDECHDRVGEVELTDEIVDAVVTAAIGAVPAAVEAEKNG